MQSIRVLAGALASAIVVVVSACGDLHAPAPKPASIDIVSPGTTSGTVGQRLASAPTFVVHDDHGNVMDGVSVTISLASGAGALEGAPSKTVNGATSIGNWTLGSKVGVDQVTIAVAGVPSLTIAVTANAGPASKITPVSATTISGRVGEVLAPAPSARVTDSFDNPIPGAAVSLAVSGGGSAPSSMNADAQGNLAVDTWMLGTIVGQNLLTLTVGSATLSFIANSVPGDPVQLAAISGDQQQGRAGAPLAVPIQLRAVDRYGNAITAPGQTATFTVTGGGGTLAATTVTLGPDGTIVMPAWTLGRTALPQTVHVTSGTLAGDISASVQTDYHIDVRFFGPDMTDAQKALFTNAAARLSAIVTGDLPDVPVANLDVTYMCGVAGPPVMNETIDDLVIFASVQNIDGPGKILAESGPCVFRNTASGFLTAVGVMEFDSSDLATMGANGILQDVITHEMLHVLGVGTLWQTKSLIQGAGTALSAYYGTIGRQGCLDSGGAAICAANVPVENNGVPGTADSHWRESTFQSELMTGYVNSGGMPLSAITVGSLSDLGYVVNPLAADPFRVPGGPGGAAREVTPSGEAWERPLPLPGALLTPLGPTLIKRP